jgi:glycosyltransferase involved in cell wall biosynthesis
VPAPSTPSIALDATPLVGVRTGIGVAVAEIIEALGRLPEPLAIVPYALSLRAREHRDRLPAGTRFPPIPARVLLKAWAHSDRPRIDRHLRPADVLHATNYLAPPSRLPTVVSVYDCSFVRNPEWCTPEVRAFEPAVRRAVGRGATIHTGSHAIAAEIDAIFGPGLVDSKRIVVVPLGAPPIDLVEAPAPAMRALTDGSRTVVAIGTQEPRKNLTALVRAFGAVAGDRDDARLVLVGPDGSDRPSIEREVRALPPGIRARVHLAGVITEPAKHALLRGATLVAYPSHYEGFGFPMLEAMQAGVPVVATAVGSIPEVAGDAALLVPAGDDDALARAVAALLDDPDRRAALASAGMAQAATFSWDRTARGLADLYERLAR